MTRKYNFIYEKLVLAEDDVVGLIAYGIYKKRYVGDNPELTIKPMEE